MTTAQTYDFTTGPATLPSVGTLSYNGCVFSPLFETNVSGKPIKDDAGRTVKFMDYDLVVDGYVTLPSGEATINGRTLLLRYLLTLQGGVLIYRGRGFDLTVGPSELQRDVAWGPVPELLEFQPLGGGRSAKIKWQVKVRITGSPYSQSRPLLQFNCETSAVYDDEGYSALHVHGTMEIPLSRQLRQEVRTLTATVDDVRSQLEARIFGNVVAPGPALQPTDAGIDLSRFHVTRREYNVSRDKRTLKFDIEAEEKPYMDLPPDCTVAHGTYTVKPATTGMGLMRWLCTLRASYVVRADRPRRVAWLAFLALLRLRMGQGNLGDIPPVQGGNQNPDRTALRSAPPGTASYNPSDVVRSWRGIMDRQANLVQQSRRVFLIDFSFDEGLYLDSRTVSFSATWTLVMPFSHILLASGLWKKLPEVDERGENLWATSMRVVSGSQSWLRNSVAPQLDVIVDFGGQ